MFADPLLICEDDVVLSEAAHTHADIPFTIANLLGTRCERIIDPGFIITEANEGHMAEFVTNGRVKMTLASTETGKGNNRGVRSLLKFEGLGVDSQGSYKPIVVQLTLARPYLLEGGLSTTLPLTDNMLYLLRSFMTPAKLSAFRDRQF